MRRRHRLLWPEFPTGAEGRQPPLPHRKSSVPRLYLCCHLGGRFSTKALVPSTRSALPKTTPNASCSKRRPASSSIVKAARSAAFAWRSATADLLAIFSASLRVVSVSSPGATTWLASPSSSAVFASNMSPVMISARLVVPDSMGQALSAAEPRNEPEVYLGLPEARFVAGDDQIACERQFKAAAEGEAVDGRDDWNRQVLETFHHAMAEAREIEAVDRRHFRHRGDIRARDEGLVAGARDDKHPHRRVVPHLANHARYFLEHLAIERVQRIEPIHGERRNRRFVKNYIFQIHTSNSARVGFSVNPSCGTVRACAEVVDSNRAQTSDRQRTTCPL